MTTAIPLSNEPLGYTDSPDETAELGFDARRTLLSQYANSPIIMSLIGALNYALDRKAAFNAFYRMVWNVDTAEGIGLDIWGRIVGVSRSLFVSDSLYLGFSASSDAVPFGSGIFWGSARLTPNFRLTDIAYRRLILAKAALNITDSSVPAINAILRALFPGYGNVYVRDNNDMTLTYVFGSALSKVDYAIVSQSGALPKPVGVSFDVEQP
jgi:ABC-type antimicrobial peptide transport system permease subunit